MECRKCVACIHRIVEYAPYIKQRVVSCDLDKGCEYERKEDGKEERLYKRKSK